MNKHSKFECNVLPACRCMLADAANPTNLLPDDLARVFHLPALQAAAAGRPAPVMVSQCTLNYAEDADFAGQLPIAAVPTFGRLVIPIAHSQPAPPSAGGGILIHLWSPEEQARELAAAAESAAAAAASSK